VASIINWYSSKCISVWLKLHFFISYNQRNLSGKREKWQGGKGLKDGARVFIFDSADGPKKCCPLVVGKFEK
jgi:hypothetical protein